MARLDVRRSVLDWVVLFFVGFSVPVLLVVGSIRLVMLPIFVNFEYQRADFPVDFYGFNTDDRLVYGMLGIEYLLNGEGIDFLARQRLPIALCWNVPLDAGDCPMFNERELRHMEDVKDLVRASFGVGIFLLVSVIALGVVLRLRGSVAMLWRGLVFGGVVTLTAIVLILFVAVLAWKPFFDAFHEVFFEEGTWRFLYSDTLIRLYPQQFWFDASLAVGGLTIVGAIVFIALGGWRLRRDLTQS